MVMAASRNYERRISDLKAVPEKVGKKSKRSILEKNVRTLESKLGKHNMKEQTRKVHYQRLLQGESELVNRLRKDQLPKKNTIDNITLNDIVNATCDLTSKKYVFPDVQAWHWKFGFLEKIPASFIRASDVSIRRDLKKGLTEENRLAQEVMSAIAQPVHSRRCWISKSRTKNGDDGDVNNNETVAGTSHDAVEDDVKYTEDVYVRVVRPFKPTHPEHLQLSLGMRIKQKFPVDVRGMSLGGAGVGLSAKANSMASTLLTM